LLYYKKKGGKIMPRMKVGKRRKPMMVTHKDEKKRELQSRMQWLLDFLNTDINSLNSVECLKLFLDFAVFIYGRSYFDLIQKEFRIQHESDLTQTTRFLNKSQECLGVNLERILMTNEEIGQESDARNPYSFDTFSVWYHVCVTKDRVFKFRHFHSLRPPFHRVLADEEEDIGLMYTGLLADALIETISRFPLSRIKTCQKPDCENYFYQKTTKSKGDFCSRKCQNWANTNRWRKANPEKYNAYHRNRRAKAKEPWVKITCVNCGHEYPKGYPDLGVCSKCEGTLKYEVQFLEGREWKSEQCRNYNEAEEFRKEILEFEKSEGRETNEKR